jgi:tRNA nucleotidyltransferase/poly(A) polymerase
MLCYNEQIIIRQDKVMEFFTVGGAVRDHVMGRQPEDVDYVVVGATPQDMTALGFKQVGADFPVFLSEDGTEYALARTERKSGKGYNGFETNFDTSITLEQDLDRRDLTINAMAMAADGLLIDPYGGRKDVDSKTLRHVSGAFRDDPVRVLRIARFHARFGPDWHVAHETIELCRKMVHSGELHHLTRERVLREMERALGEAHPHLFFDTLRTCGALDVVFEEVADVAPALLNWTMRNYPSRSARFNWAKLSALVDHPENFEKRLNVSLHFRAFSKLFRDATMLHATHPVERLYMMDAYRQQELWEALVEDCTEAGFSINFLQDAYDATRHVCFDTLPEAAREGLQGKAIGDAIRQQRIFAYDSSQLR